MAALSEADRFGEWASFMRAPDGPITITKAQLRAAVDAIDNWADANSSSFNLAIPQPARGALTSRQKALLLMRVVARRYEVTP